MSIRRAALALAGVAALAGCDIPTDVPIVEQRWVLPVESTSLSVDELLPSGVTVGGGSFNVTIAPFSTSRSLGEACPECQPFNGLTGPAPAFQDTIVTGQSLPANVSAAALQSGSIAIAIQNGFNYDPIAGGGSTTVTLTDGTGGRLLGQVVISGTLPPGSTTNRTITLEPGPIGSSVVARTVISSPGGQITTMDTSRRITVTATPTALRVGSATVNVSGQSVALDPVALDVEDIESSISDRIENGAIIFEITNPFGVAINIETSITYPGGSIRKTLAVGSGATSTATLQYSGDELRAFLGKGGVNFTGTGSVAASAGSITVTPGQQADIDAKLDLTLKIGG